jgi:hypothetical protein
MAITIVVETGAGLSNSNSYVTVAEADTYNENHYYGSDWAHLQDEKKKRAIIFATRLLDEQVDWNGTPRKSTDTSVSDHQSLRWPRNSVVDIDGYAVDFQTIPEWLKNACSELARYLTASDRTAEPATAGFSKLQVGSVSVDVDKNDQLPTMPKSVVQMITAYGRIKFGHNVKLLRA